MEHEDSGEWKDIIPLKEVAESLGMTIDDDAAEEESEVDTIVRVVIKANVNQYVKGDVVLHDGTDKLINGLVAQGMAEVL
jgi:CBS domain containing-hemolysin-like protein